MSGVLRGAGVSEAGPAATAPTTAPTTAPAAAPSPLANVPADAQELFDQIDRAYGSLKTLTLAGTLSSDVNAAGRTASNNVKFTGSFTAPNRFRHAMGDEMVCGSTGSIVYSYLKDKNIFTSADCAERSRRNG